MAKHPFAPGRHLDSWHNPEQLTTLRDQRGHPLPHIAFAGRSNAGKSSLLNALLGGRHAYVSKQPGKTRALELFATGQPVLFMDLPGYGYAQRSAQERDRWAALLEHYLNGHPDLVGVVVIVDGRHPPFDQDLKMIHWAEQANKQCRIVLNKWDACNQSTRQKNLGIWEQVAPAAILQPLSCRTGLGVDRLETHLQTWMTDASFREADSRLPRL